MAQDTTIVGQTTLPDGRILKYGATDSTGKRYEEISAPIATPPATTTPPPTTTTPPPATSTPPPATTPPPNMTDVYSGLVEPQSEAEINLGLAEDAQQANAQGPVDEAAIRADGIARLQSEIDALDRLYAQKRSDVTAQYTQFGENRVGSQAALQAGAGMIGQVSGESERSKLDSSNLQELTSAQNVVDVELQDRKSALLGEARTSADAEIAAKKLAYAGSLADKVAFLQGKVKRSKTNMNKAIQNAILNGVEITDSQDEYVQELAKQLGVSTEALVNSYNTAKATYDAKEKEAKNKQDKFDADLSKTLAGIGLTEAQTKGAIADIAKTKAEIAKLYSEAGTKGEKDFYEDIQDQAEKLSTGKATWGQAWNYMQKKHDMPEKNDDGTNNWETLDSLLNKDIWAKSGAYQNKKIGSTPEGAVILNYN